METVNNIAAAAAKAVWGENTKDGKEPVSGQQGDVSQGEPFDKGNAEEPQTTSSTTGTSSTKDTSTTGGIPESVSHAKTTGTAAESDKVPSNESTDLKAKDTPADTSKGQNDVRDPEDPQTHPKNAPTDVDDTGSGVQEGQKLDGPGPKPLSEVAKQHGGDAGKSDTALPGEDKADVGKDGKEAAATAEEDDDPNNPRAPSHGEGTGEQYVKSSGVAADGGDFDATKPGAGREADRLLEQKGIHHEKGADAAKGSETSLPSHTSGDKEKKSLGTKIKEKLHIGHKDKE